MIRRNRNPWIAIAMAVALLLGTIGVSQAYDAASGDLATQLGTAIQHSGFSAAAEEHAMAVRHLGHVLNCIAGEGGVGFDSSWGHPCGGQGAGILSDLSSHPQADDLAILAMVAHELAMEGLTQESLGSVQAAAYGVQALLRVIAGGE